MAIRRCAAYNPRDATSNGLSSFAAAIIWAIALAGKSARPSIHALAACATKGCYDGGGTLPEAGVVEKHQPCREMLLDAGEVATVIARYQLENMRDRRDWWDCLREGQAQVPGRQAYRQRISRPRRRR